MSEKPQSLVNLGRRLLSLAAPPSIISLIARLDEAEEYQDFINLVNRYVPESATQILQLSDPEDRIAAFAQAFSRRYFPLDDRIQEGDIETYSDITRFIPVSVMGMSFDDYHDLPEWRSGYQMMAYLIADPWEIAPAEGETGARMALYDSLNKILPEELLLRVPRGGLECDEAQGIFGESRYKAIALFAKILFHETRNFFLDTDDESLYDTNLPDWDDETVHELTQQWLEAEQIQNEIYAFSEWLEKNPRQHFHEVLYFLERGRYVNTTGPDANAVQLELALDI